MALFFPVLCSGVVFFSTDNNVGSEALFKRALSAGFGCLWGDSGLLGWSGAYWPNWTGFLLTSLPIVNYINWVHAIDLALASLFLAIFLRRKGLSFTVSSLLALLAAYWLGVNFCLAYAGHTNKFATLMLATLALLGIHESVHRKSIGWGIVTGGALGLALVEQQDLAFFFGLVWGLYAVFTCVNTSGWKVVPMAKVLLPMAVAILLVAAPPALVVYRSQTTEAVPGAGESSQAKWDFITQWSQPPDETIELLAPGYMGWRSGEAEGPYWGRSGRSAGWEQTRQGFMNFRLEGLYIGAIPIVFALFAGVAALFARRKSEQDDWLGEKWDNRRAEILFWSVAAIISLFLAYGKFTPLYWIFYQLPIVNNIRAPVKFLQVFQIALAILAAYGLDLALQLCKKRRSLLSC